MKNRKEGNDQESIQLSHTSHQRHQREKKTQTRNNWTLMETSLAESQTDSYFPIKWPNGYPKQKDVSDTHIQRRSITKINHGRRTALERSCPSEDNHADEQEPDWMNIIRPMPNCDAQGFLILFMRKGSGERRRGRWGGGGRRLKINIYVSTWFR